MDAELLEMREAILRIAEKHGALNVRVFGSAARGEMTEDSDVDFLVDYYAPNRTPFWPAGLLLDLEELLGRDVDIVTEDGLHRRIKGQVLEEAVLL